MSDNVVTTTPQISIVDSEHSSNKSLWIGFCLLTGISCLSLSLAFFRKALVLARRSGIPLGDILQLLPVHSFYTHCISSKVGLS